MHKKSRASREKALQILYALDVNNMMETMEPKAFEEGVMQNLSLMPEAASKQAQELAFLLIKGVYNNTSTIDPLIEKASDNWILKRLSIIDRNILRIAVYEMLFVKTVPPRVALNEAIEIAKLFSSENSPKFINGILDKIYRILKSHGLVEEI